MNAQRHVHPLNPYDEWSDDCARCLVREKHVASLLTLVDALVEVACECDPMLGWACSVHAMVARTLQEAGLLASKPERELDAKAQDILAN